MARGKFIVLEGGLGSGKTTQFEKLKEKFPQWKFYREPGSTPFGEKVRDAVQGLYDYEVDPIAALFAYSSARANLISTKIIPDLKKGRTVLLDRYWFSTYAYQGALGVDKKIIAKVSEIATEGLLPDLVLHYDLDPSLGIKRKKGNKDLDRYDAKELKFHQKVRSNYYTLSRKYRGIWHIIDASQSISRVFNDSLRIIKKHGQNI